MITDLYDKYVIFRYPFKVQPLFTLELPVGSSILHVGEKSDGSLNLWVLQAAGAAKLEKRTFYIFGTGHGIGTMENRKHIQTIIDRDDFVWHLFEETKHENPTTKVFNP